MSQIDGCDEQWFPVEVSSLGRGISNMNRLSPLGDTAESSLHTRSMWSAAPELGKCQRYAMQCNGADRAILETEQNSKIGLADANGVRQHGVEHGSELAPRGANDTQYFRCGRLLLK